MAKKIHQNRWKISALRSGLIRFTRCKMCSCPNGCLQCHALRGSRKHVAPMCSLLQCKFSLVILFLIVSYELRVLEDQGKKYAHNLR